MKALFLVPLVLFGFTGMAFFQSDSSETAVAIKELQHSYSKVVIEKKLKWIEEFGEFEEEWLKPYYIALGYLRLGRMSSIDKIDSFCEKAEPYIEKSLSLSNNNDEILCLKVFLLSTKMKVSPMLRGPIYGIESKGIIERIMKMNVSNPRAYILKAEGKANTPALFGGGCDIAKIYLTKGEELLGSNLKSILHPSWGGYLIEEVKSKCD